MHENEITSVVIDAALRIHRRLGPGLLESVYRRVLAFELRKLGFRVREEKPIPVIWEDVRLDLGFRADLLINDIVVVEVKSIDAVAPVHHKQLLTYLKLMNLRVGLLINFNVALLKDGITRMVNGLAEP